MKNWSIRRELKEEYKKLESNVLELERRLSSQQVSGIEFGGQQEFYCDRCDKNHTFPFRPGTYRICSRDITVSKDGEIDIGNWESG